MTPRPDRKRLFIFAPEMDKLGERIANAEREIEGARELISEIEEAGDLLQRVFYLVLSIRDFRSNTLTHDELYERARKAIDGVRDQIPDVILQELGPAFNRPPS